MLDSCAASLIVAIILAAVPTPQAPRASPAAPRAAPVRVPRPARPVAVVASLEGLVNLLRAGQAARRLVLLDLLHAGDRLASYPGGAATLAFFAGDHREVLRPGVMATVGTTGCAPSTAVGRRKALAGSAVNLDAVRDLVRTGRAGASLLREEGSYPPAVEPAYRSTVLSDRPTLVWAAAAGAPAYRVLLTEPSGNLLWSAESGEARLPYPSGAKPLAWGSRYIWTVTGTTEAGTALVVRSEFRVVDRSIGEELSRSEPPAEEADPAALFLLAATYQANGIQDEARRLYERLAVLVPEEPAFPALLAEQYLASGRIEEARRALSRAQEMGYLPRK